jgi:hypothetical protein
MLLALALEEPLELDVISILPTFIKSHASFSFNVTRELQMCVIL